MNDVQAVMKLKKQNCDLEVQSQIHQRMKYSGFEHLPQEVQLLPVAKKENSHRGTRQGKRLGKYLIIDLEVYVKD